MMVFVVVVVKAAHAGVVVVIAAAVVIVVNAVHAPFETGRSRDGTLLLEMRKRGREEKN